MRGQHLWRLYDERSRKVLDSLLTIYKRIRCGPETPQVDSEDDVHEKKPFDLLDAVLGEKRIVGSAAHLWDEDVATAVDMLSRRQVDGEPLLTTRVTYKNSWDTPLLPSP